LLLANLYARFVPAYKYCIRFQKPDFVHRSGAKREKLRQIIASIFCMHFLEQCRCICDDIAIAQSFIANGLVRAAVEGDRDVFA
jgi:hypothetical protein